MFDRSGGPGDGDACAFGERRERCSFRGRRGVAPCSIIPWGPWSGSACVLLRLAERTRREDVSVSVNGGRRTMPNKPVSRTGFSEANHAE